MRIYTGTGDRGETALADGVRVPKDAGRIAAFGDVDELNAGLGAALAAGLDPDVRDVVAEIQRDLFALGAHLADPRTKVTPRSPKAALGAGSVRKLEAWIDAFDGALPALRRFLLPGGGPDGAALHVARAVCRRAERSMVALGADAVPADLLRYVNRLSDLLFVLARTVNHRRGVQESEW